MMISPPAAPTEDSLVGLLVLSPNEEARRRQLDNQQERIRRLLEVRKQQKEISQKKRAEYEDAVASTWKMAVSDLYREWSLEKENQMKTLEAQRKAIEANFGVAHSMAIRTKEQEIKDAEVAKQMNEQRQREEAHRIRIAYETELQRKKAATATVEVAQQIRNRVRIKEDERTRKVVNRHRIEKASTVPPSELQSLPLQQINLNFLSTQTALSASTTNVPIKKAQSKIGRAMFDETCHHRDYAAVRCDRPVPMEETAAQVAKLVSERTERKAVKAANEIKIYNQHAKQRFNKAMDVVTLEKEKVEIFKALDKLRLEDYRRRQEVCAKGANKASENRAIIREDDLKRLFAENFISRDFGPANTPVPRPRSQSYRPRKQQQGTSAARGDMFNQKSEDSIVVVRFETSPEMKKN